MAKAKTVKKMALKEVEAIPSEDEENSDADENNESGSEENDVIGLNLEDIDEDDELNDDESGDDMEEENSKKRKHENDVEDEGPHKKRSRNKKKNVKPPTAEEMLALRETENLFQSNLFRLQIDEMLSELKPKKSVKKNIGPWIENLKNILTNLEEGESHDLSDTHWVKELNIHIPLKYRQEVNEKGIFMFKPPVEVFPVGSHSISCPLGPFYSVDLAVVMPKTFYKPNDNLNQRYHLKRALYLCYIAGKLENNDLLSSEHALEFTFRSDDLRKPLLVLHPSGKLSKFITVRIHPIPEDGTIKFKRLLPSKNNLRPQWWGLKKDILPPTPGYNASILEDVVLKQNHLVKKELFDQNKCLRDAFVLLRVWLKQRGLNEGFGSFNSHIVSMLLVYLMKINKINKHMSSYQIIRNVWLYLGDSDWLENGRSLCEIKGEEAPSLEELHLYHEVVFADVSGYFNLAASLNKYIYLQVKEESKAAMKHLDNHDINGFGVLFITKMPFIRQFDVFLSFNNHSLMSKVVKTSGDEVNLMDTSSSMAPEFVRLVTELLEKGIGHRLTNIGVQLSPLGSWSINSNFSEFKSLSIGLNLDVATAMSLIDKGPEPNDPGAEEFRDFWGDKCDLRRFKDGTICESVVWDEKSPYIEMRRYITSNIVNHLLSRKLNINFCNMASNSFQTLVVSNISKNTTLQREEICKKILSAYEELSRQLQDLSDLPLSIVSIHCISPAYRFTEPFPPTEPLYHRKISPFIDDPVKGRIFPNDGAFKFSPQYIAPIDCVVQMALTGKWPNDVNAGKRLLAAFNIAITEGLKKHYNLSCQVTTDYFVVNKGGFLFRLFLGYSKEIGLLKLKISEEGVRQYRDTPQSLALEKKFINLPKITGAIYRLSEEYPGFSSATCLAKRWFASQLLDETHFPGLLIEMMMAYIFINPQPYSHCLTLLPAYLRFLTFISTTDWATTPLIVNFNSILTSEDIKEIEDAFREDRSSFPPLFLASPYDRTGSLWTKSVPTLTTLVRVTKLAAASLQIIETNIIDESKSVNILRVFRPPMTVYDAVIKLNKAFQYRREESLFLKGRSVTNKFNAYKTPCLPIVGFNPVDLYLEDLRENYSDFALFFYNPQGGLDIGVLFKPTFLENIPFQSSLANARKPILEKGKPNLKPHIDSIFDGFKILGNGIVVSIELVKLQDSDIKAEA